MLQVKPVILFHLLKLKRFTKFDVETTDKSNDPPTLYKVVL